MLDKKDFREAYAPLHASEGTLKEVMKRATATVNPRHTPAVARPISRYRRPVRIALTAACVTVMLLAGSIVTLAVTVPSIRDAIEHWTEEICAVKLTTDDTYTEEAAWSLEASYTDFPSALTANGITEPLTPQWFPDGYVVEGVDYEKNALGQRFVARYSNTDSATIIIHLTIYEDISIQYELDDEGIIRYDTHGITHYIMADNNTTKAIWTHDNCESVIAFPEKVLVDDIIKMIDSIYEKQDIAKE